MTPIELNPPCPQSPGAPGSGARVDTKTWSEYATRYLPGDLVETEFGLVIIAEAHQTQGEDNYSVWPLPGWKWRRESWGWSPVKIAWYRNDELSLIEAGPASKRRPKTANVLLTDETLATGAPESKRSNKQDA